MGTGRDATRGKYWKMTADVKTWKAMAVLDELIDAATKEKDELSESEPALRAYTITLELSTLKRVKKAMLKAGVE